MATIKDVADHCGVSIATVSAVINGAGWVPTDTRDRVYDAIQLTNYRPNSLARSLKTRKSGAIGAIVSDLTNPFFTEIVRSVEHVLREKGRNLFLCDSDHQYTFGEKNLRMLLEKRVDALVLVGASVKDETLKAYTDGQDTVPIIAIERDYDIPNVARLLVDSEQGGYDATKHLIDQGYRRVAFIAGPASGPGATTYGRIRRRRGYERALVEYDREVRDEYIVRGDFRFEGGQRAMEKLLSLSKPPDAVFAANDLMALGALRTVRERGIKIPDDVGLVGYDNIQAASLVTPSLTTLAMPKKELGATAAELILRRIDDPDYVAPAKQMFSAKLIVRESSVSS